jgi:hypothetical protein
MRNGAVRPVGSLQTKVSRKTPSRTQRWLRRIGHAYLAMRGYAGVFYAELHVRHYIAAEARWVDYGAVCRRAVTDEFVALLVDELQASLPAHTRFFDFKFHDSGTGTNAENQTDTTLQTPTGIARATGTQAEGASANIYKSVGTITYDNTYAITEHGLFSAASGSDELMDRSKFDAINVVNLDSIEFTYELTVSAGG